MWGVIAAIILIIFGIVIESRYHLVGNNEKEFTIEAYDSKDSTKIECLIRGGKIANCYDAATKKNRDEIELVTMTEQEYKRFAEWEKMTEQERKQAFRNQP